MREEREEKGGASRNPKWRSIKIGGGNLVKGRDGDSDGGFKISCRNYKRDFGGALEWISRQNLNRIPRKFWLNY